MKSKPTQTTASLIFQWSVIALGGGLWLCDLLQLLTTRSAPELGGIALLTLAALAISFKPVYITTPGMSLSHKRQLSISLSDAVSFLLLVLYGAPAAILASGLDGFVASYRTVKRLGSNLFSLAMFAISFFLAGHAYEFLLRHGGIAPGAGLQTPAQHLLAPLFVAAAIHFLNASWMISIILGLRYRTSIRRQWLDNQLWTAVTYFPLPLATLFTYYCVQSWGWQAVIIAAPVLLLIYISLSQYNQKVEEKMHKIAEMNELHLAVVQALALAIDAKDGNNARHVERVKIYGRGLARAVGLSELETQAIETGAMLHDIGRLAVPDYIINKPGKLTAAEFEKMKTHTVVGAEILSTVKFPYPLVPVVRSHHERWDGTGYPDGLRGADIPLTARILALVDCYDALCEDRRYRRSMTRAQAIATLEQEAGAQFDPTLVEAFLTHLPEFEAEIARRELASETPLADGAEIPAAHPADNSEPPVAQPHEKIKEAHREVLLLYELSQTINSSLSLRDTLVILLARIADIVPFATGAVYLQERDRAGFKVVHATGKDADVLRGRHLPVGAGSAGWVIANRAASAGLEPALDFAALSATPGENYRAALLVPLMQADEAFGALALYSTEPEHDSSEHLRLLESIARLASDAIVNANRHEEIEATALTDRLTGIPNLRAILTQFEQEASRARRHRHKFTMLMMDLDGFKAVNDTLGHPTGDRYLIEISKVIKEQLRDYDFFGRYAGDEFIAILPRTRRDEIGDLTERIRRAVQHFTLVSDGGATARAGVSIGAAEFGADGITLEDLMRHADAAMYGDKARKTHRTLPVAADFMAYLEEQPARPESGDVTEQSYKIVCQ